MRIIIKNARRKQRGKKDRCKTAFLEETDFASVLFCLLEDRYLIYLKDQIKNKKKEKIADSKQPDIF